MQRTASHICGQAPAFPMTLGLLGLHQGPHPQASACHPVTVPGTLRTFKAIVIVMLCLPGSFPDHHPPRPWGRRALWVPQGCRTPFAPWK